MSPPSLTRSCAEPRRGLGQQRQRPDRPAYYFIPAINLSMASSSRRQAFALTTSDIVLRVQLASCWLEDSTQSKDRRLGSSVVRRSGPTDSWNSVSLIFLTRQRWAMLSLWIAGSTADRRGSYLNYEQLSLVQFGARRWRFVWQNKSSNELLRKGSCRKIFLILLGYKIGTST